MEKSTRRGSVAVVMALTSAFTAVTGLTSAPAASAEGSWEDRFDMVPAGFESRRWVDQNSDDAVTAVVLLGCTSDPEITLYRENGSLPDTQVGPPRTVWCDGWASYGDLPAGTYYFTITDTGSPDGHLSVDHVQVYW